MPIWLIVILVIILLGLAGALWLRWKMKEEAERIQQRKRESYSAKRRALVEGSKIKTVTPPYTEMVGWVVRVVNNEEVIAILRREDASPSQAEEGPFPIRFITEIDGTFFGID